MTANTLRLRKRAIAAYGIGDLGFNLFYTTLSIFLLVYYTDILSIDPITAGAMAAGPILWDAITDPVMGVIASRTHTRFGQYRPYILFGAPLCALSFVGMFAAPVLFPSAVIVSSVVAHLVFRTLYTVVNVPYAAMTVVLTADSKERSYLAGARMLCAMAAGLMAAVLMFPLASTLGDGNVRLGFVYVAALYAGVATLAMLLVFFATSERMDEQVRAAPLSYAQTWSFLRGNRAFWVLAAAVFAASVGSSVTLNAINWYVADYIGAPGEQGTVLLAVLLGVGISIPFWTWMATRTSKARTWIIAGIPGILFGVVVFLIAPRDVGSLALWQLVAGVFGGAVPVMLWSMVPDTVEYGEWRSGVRDEAIGFGLVQLALKSASSVAALLLGVYLEAIGYVVPDARTAELGQGTLEGLRLATFILPGVFSLISLLIISRYPIDHVLHGRLSRGLAWRRRARQVPSGSQNTARSGV